MFRWLARQSAFSTRPFDACAVLKDIHVLRDMDVRHAEEAEKRDKAEKRRHKADIRGDIRRHTEAMQAGERRHAEAMAALHELIRRTAAPQGA